MHIILGEHGYTGSAAAKALVNQHQPVTIVTRKRCRGEEWMGRGAEVAVADVHSTKRTSTNENPSRPSLPLQRDRA